jgi:glyoxylase I family protein
MRVTGPDHLVLICPDPEAVIAWYHDVLGLEAERLDEWRRGEVLFASLRVSDTFIIDVQEGERTGENVNHFAMTVEGVDLDELAAGGTVDVVAGPADLFGARGQGRGLYIKDPGGNLVELRTY